jgi:hypothetical protein
MRQTQWLVSVARMTARGASVHDTLFAMTQRDISILVVCDSVARSSWAPGTSHWAIETAQQIFFPRLQFVADTDQFSIMTVVSATQ